MVLHSSEILIIKSLSLVVNKLFKLGATENIIEFPLYLDEAAK